MKLRNAQSDQRTNADSARVHALRTVVNSSAEDSDSKTRYEACSPPRMRIFKLPLSHTESAVVIASKSNSNQKRADAGIEACEVEHRSSRGKWRVSHRWQAKIMLSLLRK